MMNFLNLTEVVELKEEHRGESDSRRRDRIKSVLMLNSGVSASKVAEYLLLDEKTIRKYLRCYLDDGIEGLEVEPRIGRSAKLSLEQLDTLERELRSKIYPTTTSIKEFIRQAFSIDYSIAGVTDLLKRLGFSYKKPQAVPGKADAKAQEEFLSKLEALKQAKNQDDPILYIDSSHPQHNSHPDYGWLPKGENVKLKTNTGRKRVTITGALNSENHDILVQEDQILNAQTTIEFFKKIENSYLCSKNVYLILDNAGYFRGKAIQEYIATSRLKLLYLPPYAPNLNLIERVWKFFKKHVLANAYYESYLEFRKGCLGFFTKQSWRSHRKELNSLLSDNFQIIGN